MAHTLSAKKRIRQTQKRTLRNISWKKKVKKKLKEFEGQPTLKVFQTVQQTLDKAAKAGILEKNKARRLKSKLAKAVKDKTQPR